MISVKFGASEMTRLTGTGNETCLPASSVIFNLTGPSGAVLFDVQADHERSSAHRSARIVTAREVSDNKKVLPISCFAKENRHQQDSEESVGGLNTFARVLRRLQSILGRSPG
jgi:hypothetical protein